LVTEEYLQRARALTPTWAAEFGWPEKLVHFLADRHGMEAEAILQLAASQAPRAQNAEERLWCAEALHAMEHTQCMHLRDLFIRRTPLVLSRADHGRNFVSPVAETMAGWLGWNQAELREEINALQNQISGDLSAVSTVVDPAV